MTPPIDPSIATAAEALKSVQDLAAQVVRLRQDLETAQKQNRDGFANMERVKQERDAWEDTAQNHYRNEQYYRGLLLEVAKHLGDGVFVCDDGSRSEDPLVAKVPELVARLAHENETLARQVPPEPPTVYPSTSKPEDTVVEGSMSIGPSAFRKCLGQQWCCMIDTGLRPSNDIRISVGPGLWVVLCNVYQDAIGSLTYEPVAINDLPKIP